MDVPRPVFIERGYPRTQMADVAEALGVAKGTLYLYVESKEALFDLVARYADAARPFAEPPSLPVPTPKPGATLKYVRERLAQSRPLRPYAALARQRVGDVRGEIEAIVSELYDTLARNRRGHQAPRPLRARLPELAALWFEGARGGLISDCSTQYLHERMRRGNSCARCPTRPWPRAS